MPNGKLSDMRIVYVNPVVNVNTEQNSIIPSVVIQLLLQLLSLLAFHNQIISIVHLRLYTCQYCAHENTVYPSPTSQLTLPLPHQTPGYTTINVTVSHITQPHIHV